MKEGEKVASQLLEAHGDAAKVLDALEEAFHEAPLFVEMTVDPALARTVGLGVDDDTL